MRIAYIAPTGVFGGVRIVHEHLTRLAQRGHECTLIHLDQQPLTWLPARYPQRPVSDPGSGYDVVVGTAIMSWPLARQLAGAGAAYGLLQMAEWLFAPKDSEIYRETIKAFTTPLDGVLAISEWLARLAETVPGRPVHRVRNGIDTTLFYPEPFPDIPDFDGVTIATDGQSPNPAKDMHEMTLRAIRQLRYDDGLPLRVIGFGQGPATAEIYERYWQLPSQLMIRRIYSSSDIFLKASRYEGRPGPDMEAMACGAVVCRAIGAGDDDLLDGENCLKVSYGDFEGFVSNLKRLIADPDLRARLRENALRYVRERYDWPGAIDLIERALTGDVSAPQPPRHEYELSEYDEMQRQITWWEGAQASWLAETLDDMLHPRSVIDIGCGPGSYLVAFKPQTKVLGVDGAPQAGQMLEPDEFARVDLRHDWYPSEHYDLSLCIETAEHLPPDRADYLVDLITRCSDVCVWSAAQPGQGGMLHLNEQPKSYWLEKFRARGWDLHPLNDELVRAVAANPDCRRIQWLVGNVMMLCRSDANGTESNVYSHADA